MLSNMDPPPAEENFCDDTNRPVKHHIVERHNRHVDSSDRMADSYSMSRRTFKWTTKLFFQLLNLNILNSSILKTSCKTKDTDRDFRLLLVRKLIEEAGKCLNRPNSFCQEEAVLLQRILEGWKPGTIRISQLRKIQSAVVVADMG